MADKERSVAADSTCTPRLCCDALLSTVHAHHVFAIDMFFERLEFESFVFNFTLIEMNMQNESKCHKTLMFCLRTCQCFMLQTCEAVQTCCLSVTDTLRKCHNQFACSGKKLSPELACSEPGRANLCFAHPPSRGGSYRAHTEPLRERTRQDFQTRMLCIP